jgi:maltose/moltooligosaccharide transporter
MGLIVQPIIGHYSDKTWGNSEEENLSLVGALLASIGLILMPQANFIAFLPALWVGAGMLMIMDASLIYRHGTFQSFGGDNLRTDQRTLGLAYNSINWLWCCYWFMVTVCFNKLVWCFQPEMRMAFLCT